MKRQKHRYSVFVSHAWAHGEAYDHFALLRAADDFEFADYSVPEHDPVEGSRLPEELREQIRPASVVIVLAGMYLNHSEWMKFEFDYARDLGKPILAVRPWGAERMPKALAEAADETVAWQTSSVVEAIRRLC